MSANDEERVYIDGIPPQCDLFDVKRIFDDTCSPLNIRFFDKDQRYPPFRTATAFFKNLTESLKAIVLFNVRPVSTATTTFNPILSLSVETARTRYHNCRLAVRGIPRNATLEDVYRLFNPFGLILLIQLSDDYHNDQCKYAKVFYADRFSAQTACRRLNGASLKGSIIIVKVKDSKPSTHQPHQSTYFRPNAGTATMAAKRSGSLVSVPTGAQNVIPSSQTYEEEVIREGSNQHSELEASNASTAPYKANKSNTTKKKNKIAETRSARSAEEEPMTKPLKLHSLRRLGDISDRLLQSDADSGSWSTDTSSHAFSILYEKMLRLKTSNADHVEVRSLSWGGNPSDTHQIMLGLNRRGRGLLNGLTVRLGSKMWTNNLETAWKVAKHPNSAIGVDRFQNRYSSVHPQEQPVANPPAPLIRR
ncbi:hypothetical protein BKA69DRAFT_335302 [Paraphysoderma sedebokerense]|nr:hypothetical protein BKA69DRAFT_335302 [Paraphysoderma sedebokerense]